MNSFVHNLDEPKTLIGKSNTSRRLNRAAEHAAKEFSGLPVGVSRWDILSLVKKLQRELGLTSTQTSHLEFLIGYTRDQDWQFGSHPIIYLTVSATAVKRGVSERQVLNIERALNRAGLLCWHDSGNQRRYGYRSDSGDLVSAFGVNLAPLAACYERFCVLVKAVEEKEHAWKQQKMLLLMHKRVLREQIALHPQAKNYWTR
ncbi:replication initiation protein RepC [Pseudovibrio denitrificans]|uniref:Replication initiation protein RepC n=2 Tax=Pseudovibrio denitrificans TaxID=258256 RepID=A0A1I7DYU2_9HYPH|nr:helix-turn-helix domain-containing protein [Pseudovibrio denitrificans]SFU16848.1 replication initiation protein RepC [Pseudovibrio denitrificans]